MTKKIGKVKGYDIVLKGQAEEFFNKLSKDEKSKFTEEVAKALVEEVEED